MINHRQNSSKIHLLPDSSDLNPKSFGYFFDATRTSSSIIRRNGVISVRGHCLKTINQTYYLHTIRVKQEIIDIIVQTSNKK